jgi:hypothetical protein
MREYRWGGRDGRVGGGGGWSRINEIMIKFMYIITVKVYHKQVCYVLAQRCNLQFKSQLNINQAVLYLGSKMGKEKGGKNAVTGKD